MSDALNEALAQLQADAQARRQRSQAEPSATSPNELPGQDEERAAPPAQARHETARDNRDPLARLGVSGFDILRFVGAGVRAGAPSGSLQDSIGADIQRADGTITNPVVRGAARGVNETADLGAELGTAAGDAIGERFPETRPALIQFSRNMERLGFRRNEAPDIPTGRPESAGVDDRLVEGVSQFLTGYVIGGRVLKLIGVPVARATGQAFLRSSAQGAIGDFIAFDGNDERLSNLVEAVPQLRNPVTQFLAADTEDDELSGRLKNVLEGLGLGVMAEALLTALRGTRALARGNREGVEEAAQQLEREVSARSAGAQTAGERARPVEPQTPPNNPIRAAVDVVRSRLGLGARRVADETEAEALAALRTEAGNRAAASVDIEGLSPEDAAARQGEARQAAAQAAEAEFRRIRQEQAPPAGDGTSRGSDSGAQASDAARGPGSAEVPEGVLSSREDVSALLDEIEFNRNFTDELNIKPDTEPTLTRQHGEWTLNTYGTPENLDAALRALVERTRPKSTLSDAQLQADTLRAAAELGQSPEDALSAGAHIAGIAGDIPRAVNTMRVLWRRTVQEVDAHVGRDIGTASPDEFSNIVRSIHNALVFSNYMAQVKSAMGRGLRVFQLPDADTYARVLAEGDPENALVGGARELPNLPRDRQEVSDWLELWGLTRENPQARADFLEGQQALPDQWQYLRNSFANLFTANVLSGVPSIMLNVVGPSMVGALRTIEKTTGAGILSLNPFVTGAQRAQYRSAARNAMVAYVQAMGDIRDVFNYARQAVAEGRSILGGGGSVSDRASQFGPITDGMLRNQGLEPSPGYWAGNIVNMWPHAFSRLNNGLDEFSKRLAFIGEVRARALVEASEQGLNGDALREFVAQRVRNSTDEVGAAADEDMLRAAERTTFTGSPGSEGSKGRQISNLINDWRANTPEIRYVLPIFNVPANALGETLTRVPVLNFALRETREELLGNRGVVAQAEAHGRMLLGASFLTAGFFLTRSGQLTGAGPESPTDRRVWLMTHQPYSIRIGDEWVDYSRYDVIGSLLGIPATVFDATINRRQDLELFEVTIAGAAALSEFFRDKAALQTVSDLLSFGERGQSEQAFADRFFGNVGGRTLVPNFVTQLGRQAAGDDTARTKTNAFQYMLDLIPGASSTLDPQRNVWGEPIHRPKDTFLENVAPITMTPASVYADDPLTDELDRLYSVTGYAAGVTQQDDISGGFYDAREVELEDGHSLYDAIIRARTEVRVDGLTLRQAMQELFDSVDYADAVDADASNRYTSNDDTSRGYLISQVFREYHREAMREVARNSDIGARYIAATSAKRTDDALLRPYSARELVETQGLAEALGIDLEAYIARARDE